MGMVSPDWGRARRTSSFELSLAPPGPNGGKRSQTSGNYAWEHPHLWQQLEANWLALIRETEAQGRGASTGKEAKPSTGPL